MKKAQVKYEWVLDDLSKLPEFSEEFRSYCEGVNLDESKIFELELSLEELIVNSMTHGYKGEEAGTVTVETEDRGADIRVSLRDTAPPFNLFRDAPPPRLGGEDAEPEAAAETETELVPRPVAEDLEAAEAALEAVEEKEGGLGIHLVKSLNDKVEYYGSQDGNVVIIIKSKS